MTYKGDPKLDENLTSFEYSDFNGKIIFDSVKMQNVYLYDFIGDNICRLILKNLTESLNYSSSFGFFVGGKMNVRIDNCTYKNSDF
jgi:hypothetical protein